MDTVVGYFLRPFLIWSLSPSHELLRGAGTLMDVVPWSKCVDARVM